MCRLSCILTIVLIFSRTSSCTESPLDKIVRDFKTQLERAHEGPLIHKTDLRIEYLNPLFDLIDAVQREGSLEKYKKQLRTLVKQYDINDMECNKMTPLAYYLWYPTKDYAKVISEFCKVGAKLVTIVPDKYDRCSAEIINDKHHFYTETLICNLFFPIINNEFCSKNFETASEAQCIGKAIASLLHTKLCLLRKEYFQKIFFFYKLNKKRIDDKLPIIPRQLWFLIINKSLSDHKDLGEIHKSLEPLPCMDDVNTNCHIHYFHKTTRFKDIYPKRIEVTSPLEWLKVHEGLFEKEQSYFESLCTILNPNFFKQPVHRVLQEFFKIQKEIDS